MIRPRLSAILALLLVTALLTALALTRPPQETESSLSVLVLRPQEGNAIVVSCDRQTALLSLGDSAQQAELAEYLDRNDLQIDHLLQPVQEQTSLALGRSRCVLQSGEAGALRLQITHGENELELLISPEGRVTVRRNDEAPEALEDGLHSTRFFSDGETLTQRPDFTAWDR